MIGDFNINCHQTNKNDVNKTRLIRIMNFYGLKLRVNKFTRITDRSKSQIDNMFTNNNTVDVDVVDTDMVADHKSIVIRKQASAVRQVRKIIIDRSKYSSELLSQKITIHQSVQQNINCLNEKAQQFESILKKSVSEIYSEKEIYVNYANKWFNEPLRALRAVKRDLLLRAQLIDTPVV